LVQLGRGRRHHLEVGEETTWTETFRNLGEEPSLPVVLQMVDREPGHDHVETPECSERFGKIAGADLDPPVVSEPRGRAFEHRR
jgi:hypothetical protein